MMFGLKDMVVKQINSVFASFPQIEKVILYGSRAKGTYKNGSDIDLVLVGKNLNLSILCSVDNRLDELYLPFTIDTSILHQITENPVLEHIQRVGVVFYDGSTKSQN